MIEKTCEICGKKIDPTNAISDGRYCSPECQWESMRIPKYYKNCPVCGRRFYSNSYGHKKKFCSIECAGIGKRSPGSTPWAQVNKTREICGKNFTVCKSNAERGRGKYCSKECAAEGAKTGMMLECPVCGKSFYATRSRIDRVEETYCSRECASVGVKTGETRECKHCGKEFYVPQCIIDRRSAMYCSPECVLRAKGNATAIEIETAEALEFFGVDFIQQWKPDNYERIFDFKAGEVTIEVNGDYWHTLPGAEERDKEKENWAIENGFNPITIWEHEIKKKGAKELIRNRVIPLLNLEVVSL